MSCIVADIRFFKDIRVPPSKSPSVHHTVFHHTERSNFYAIGFSASNVKFRTKQGQLRSLIMLEKNHWMSVHSVVSMHKKGQS